MTTRLLSTSSSGVKKFILFHIIAFIFVTRPIFAQNPKIKFEIKETSEHIIINTKVYSLSIDKQKGIAFLKNWQGASYTSFPLNIAFNINGSTNQPYLQRQWKIRDRSITMTATQNDVLVQEIKIACSDESFDIQLSARLPSVAESGAYLLRNPSTGFDRSNWEEYFSPEPDDYFKSNPTVDIRVDRDQQWTFTPAPLNLSFKTTAGWFSIGLAELPDASIYTFKDDALWLDFPWRKVLLSDDYFFRFPALIVTFNTSPWEAVGDYYRRLMKNNENKPVITGGNQRPIWWVRPIVSTRGEQRIQKITDDHPEFNNNWVKNYILRQQKALDSLKFNLIIDNKWACADGDPVPSNRFHDLRNLIDWCHDQGLKVILFWKAWKVEANSLAINMNVTDGEYVDATHPLFESYVDSCCEILMGNNSEGLNADGLKIDELFLVRDPVTANYRNSEKGMGFREVYLYLATIYRAAKKYKADALIMSSAIDPHFSDIQDMARINDDWDNKIRREKRARIITQALPGLLINGDAADLSLKIATYHYVTSSVYGIPSIQYLDRFQDGEITIETQKMLAILLKLFQQMPHGKLKFVDYGNWQIQDKNNEVLAESILSGKGILIFRNNEASFLCTENSKVHLALDRHILKAIYDEKGIKMPFLDLGHGLYELENPEQGKIYQFHLKKISTKRR